jgi:transcriptional regulator with XRE-family HTH domain
MSLERVRESKSFSEYQFASQMGLTTEELINEELINIEEGKKAPRLCLAQKMANALGLSFEDFARHYYEKATRGNWLRMMEANKKRG